MHGIDQVIVAFIGASILGGIVFGLIVAEYKERKDRK